jgi:hypothetical protein
MGWARPAVRIEGRGHFGDSHPEERGAYHHLGREFHSGGAKVHAAESFSRKAAESAMKIPRGAAEKQAADGTENGIADVAVFPRHRAGPDAAEKAVSHHDVVALAKLCNQGGEGAEVLAVIGVAHDDVPALCGDRGVINGRSVAANRNIDHTSAMPFGDFDGTIR